jgi:hypothetical protein
VPPYVAAPGTEWSAEIDDPLRKLAFRFGLILIFLRFSLLQFILTFVTSANLRLLYVFGLPALIGVVLNGGIRRTFASRNAWYWTGYAAWMIVAVPFSVWKGGSASVVIGFWRTVLPMLLIMGGLGMTWREYKSVLRTLAWAAVVSMIAGPLFDKDYGTGRAGMEFGTVADPNDYAAHLLLLLPFLLWVVLDAKSKFARAAAMAGLGAGIIVVFRTGSRGGAVGLALGVLYFFFRATTKQRIVMALLIPVGIMAILAVAPQRSVGRILSLVSSTDSQEFGDAEASTLSRLYLLRKSIEYTLQFPVFGVGADQFAMYEGEHNAVIGTHGMWHGTHNTFTQVSSENGIPALLFFVAGVVSSYRLFSSVRRQARERMDCGDIESAAVCGMVAMVAFYGAISFLNFAYLMYAPAIGGLAILCERCARNEMRDRAGAPPPEPVAPWAAPVPRPRRAIRNTLSDSQA